jgi:hypothetical protein
MWRTLIFRKQFGFRYSENEDPRPGLMAIFCGLCAQPRINLPKDWKEYENRCISRYLYLEVADGLLQQKSFYVRLYNGWQFPSRGHKNEDP